MKPGKLIPRKVIKIVATRCHILKLKCSIFDFGLGSVTDPTERAYNAPPDPVARFKGPTSEGREGTEGMGGRGREDRGRKGRGKGRVRKGVPYYQFSLLATLHIYATCWCLLHERFYVGAEGPRPHPEIWPPLTPQRKCVFSVYVRYIKHTPLRVMILRESVA